MDTRLPIVLTADEWGQLCDGLEVRASSWEETARYLETGEMPRESFVIADCDDVEEASRLADQYRAILASIYDQLRAHRGTPLS